MSRLDAILVTIKIYVLTEYTLKIHGVSYPQHLIISNRGQSSDFVDGTHHDVECSYSFFGMKHLLDMPNVRNINVSANVNYSID